MTERVSGAVVHWTGNLPVIDPNGTKPIAVDLPSGPDNETAAVVLVSKYIHDLPAANRDDMLVDATNGLVRVMNIKRTKLPIIGGQEDETQQEST